MESVYRAFSLPSFLPSAELTLFHAFPLTLSPAFVQAPSQPTFSLTSSTPEPRFPVLPVFSFSSVPAHITSVCSVGWFVSDGRTDRPTGRTNDQPSLLPTYLPTYRLACHCLSDGIFLAVVPALDFLRALRAFSFVHLFPACFPFFPCSLFLPFSLPTVSGRTRISTIERFSLFSRFPFPLLGFFFSIHWYVHTAAAFLRRPFGRRAAWRPRSIGS